MQVVQVVQVFDWQNTSSLKPLLEPTLKLRFSKKATLFKESYELQSLQNR